FMNFICGNLPKKRLILYRIVTKNFFCLWRIKLLANEIIRSWFWSDAGAAAMVVTNLQPRSGNHGRQRQ
ncbi:MAG: hypothetical protein ABL897_10305, partial [Hyphomicrobium sp.]